MQRMAARALWLLLAGAVGCSKCGSSASSAEELLPPAPAMAAATGTLGALAEHARGLAERAATVPGGELLGDYRKQLVAQLGFDPLTREGLLSAGLDPDRGAAVSASLPDGPQGRPSWVIAAPLTKPDLFAATVDRLVGERSGYPLRSEEARAGVKVVVFARSATPGPRVAYGIVRGYGLLARGNDPAAAIAAAVQRKREESLAADAAFSDGRARMKGDAAAGSFDLLLQAPAGSELGRRLTDRPLPGELGLLLSFASTGLTARLRLGLPPDQRERFAAVLPGGGAALLSLLPDDAPLQLRLGAAPTELPALAARLPLARDLLAALRQNLAGKGVDLDKDLFGALVPGVVAAAGSAKALQLSRAVDFGFLDWRTQSPFDFVSVAAAAEVAPGKKERLLAALDAVAQAMPLFGATAARQGDGWQVTYAGGAGARFGVRDSSGKTLAYLVGGGVAEELLAPHAGSADPTLAANAGAAASLDLGKLAAALRALPESTYGSGPQSYIARSIVDRVVEPFKLLRLALALAPTPQGLEATARVEIAPAPAAPAPKP